MSLINIIYKFRHFRFFGMVATRFFQPFKLTGSGATVDIPWWDKTESESGLLKFQPIKIEELETHDANIGKGFLKSLTF